MRAGLAFLFILLLASAGCLSQREDPPPDEPTAPGPAAPEEPRAEPLPEVSLPEVPSAPPPAPSALPTAPVPLAPRPPSAPVLTLPPPKVSPTAPKPPPTPTVPPAGKLPDAGAGSGGATNTGAGPTAPTNTSVDTDDQPTLLTNASEEAEPVALAHSTQPANVTKSAATNESALLGGSNETLDGILDADGSLDGLSAVNDTAALGAIDAADGLAAPSVPVAAPGIPQPGWP